MHLSKIVREGEGKRERERERDEHLIGFGATLKVGHNASEASTRVRIAPEEGGGCARGIPLPRCGKILKSKTEYAFLATLYHFTALLPCFTIMLINKLITRQSLSLNYTIVNMSQHQLNMLDVKIDMSSYLLQ